MNFFASPFRSASLFSIFGYSSDSEAVKSQKISSDDVHHSSETETGKAEPQPSAEKKPSPCCCCKETKQARDACIVENGAENCADLIEAHRVCMRGFAQFSSELGSGAGKGGGGGGAIREAGGSFGKMEAAHEEQYFRKQQAEQLQKLKKHMTDEVAFHEDAIKRHQEALKKAKDDLSTMAEK